MHDERHDSRSGPRRADGRSRLAGGAWFIAALLLLPPADPHLAAQRPPGEVLVMPFDNPHHDPKLIWLGEGSATVLAELLARYGAATVPRDERLTAFDRLQLPPAAALSHATVIKVGQFVGAAEVVIGSYELAGDHLTVRARAIRLDAGRLGDEVIERGPLTDLFGLYDRVARRLRGATAAAPAPAEGTLLTSHHGFELYVKGLVAESPAAQRTYLEQAAKAVPGDERINLALWQVHTEAGRHLEALTAVSTIATASPHSRAARYLLARSQLELKRYDDAFGTLKALQSEARSPEVLNALGVVQLRRGATPQSGVAVYYFSQASQLEPTDVDYFFNLGYGYWLEKDPQAAIYWLREAVRLDPTDGDAHLVLAAALQQAGAKAEANRERDLARRLALSFDADEVKPFSESVPRGLERVKDSLDRPSNRVDSILASTGQRDQAELAQHHLEAGRRAYDSERYRDAEQELRRALYLSPYLADAHLLLGRVYFGAGRTAEAIQAFKIALWSDETVEGHVALAEAYLATQSLEAARQEITRALALDPSSAEAQALRAKIGQK